MPAYCRSLVASGSTPARIVGAHLAVVAAGGLMLGLGPITPVRWAGAIATGTSLFALSGLLREAGHRRLARRTWLNDALGLLAGASIVLPPSAFRAFEADHHGATNRAGDPHRPLNRRVMLLAGLPLYVGLGHLHALRTLRGGERTAYLAEVVALGLLVGLIGAGLGWLALGPVLVAMLGHNLRIVAAHLDLPAGRFADTWQLVLPGPLSRWLLHADHHLEQHLRPEVRWADLPLVRAEIERGGFLPAWQRVTPGQFARVLLARRAPARDADPASAPEPSDAPRWAGRAAIRARRPQPNHPPRDSVTRLASE